MTSRPESPAERQARLRAELMKRDARERREAFHAEMRGYLDAAGAAAARTQAVEEVLRAIAAGLPALVTVARLAPSDREGVAAGRAWWRQLREREADRAQAEAEMLPEFVPWHETDEGGIKQ